MTDSNRIEADSGATAGWITTRFVPGSATGLIGRRTIGLIEANDVTTRDRLWALVDADAAIDDILDELTSRGLKSLPSFGVAEIDGDIVRVVARGRVSVVAERSGAEAREIDPSGVRTWTEEALSDVESVTMRIADGDTDDATDSDPYFVLAGIVPASALIRSYAADATADSADEVGESSSSAQSMPTEEVAATDRAAEIDEEPEAPLMDSLWADSPSEPEGIASNDSAPPSPFDDQATDDADESAGSGPAVAEPSSEPARDVSNWSERHVLGVLAFSNGERIPVDGSVLIGRNPKFSDESDGSPLPRIMKFDGPNQGLSRTHAEIRVDGSDIVLEDLHSTNGTEIRLPGQQPERVPGGAPIVIVPGAQIDFGDELFCTLETADA